MIAPQNGTSLKLLSSITGSLVLGGVVAVGLSGMAKTHNVSRALDTLVEDAPSVDDISPLRMLSILKAQGIEITHEELAGFKQKYDSMSEEERISVLTHHMGNPILPQILGT